MQLPAGMTLPPGMKMPAISPALLEGVDQVAMYKLMGERHLSVRAAVYLMKSKIQLLDQTQTSVHVLVTGPDGATADETITLTPNYTPTATDLERAARSHRQIYNPRLSYRNTGPDSARWVLQYG